MRRRGRRMTDVDGEVTSDDHFLSFVQCIVVTTYHRSERLSHAAGTALNEASASIGRKCI